MNESSNEDLQNLNIADESSNFATLAPITAVNKNKVFFNEYSDYILKTTSIPGT